MKAGKHLVKIVLLVLAASLSGPGCWLMPRKRPPETIVPLAQLVGEYNANAARVPQLWARAKIKVTVPGKLGIPFPLGSTSRLATPNGLLLLFKGDSRLGPHDFVVIGREAGMELFRVGSSTLDDTYYCWYAVGQYNGLWWGRNEYAGAPGVEGLLIDPHQLLAVLGVCELPDDFTEAPTVVLSMDDDPPEFAYVVSYIEKEKISGRLLFRREVLFRWDDKRWRHPFRVNFFDARGVRVMTADLRDYEHIEVAGADEGSSRPVMPTDIRIRWPEKKTSIHIVLSEMVVDEELGGSREACMLRNEDGDLPVEFSPDRIIQVDRGVGQGGSPR